MNNMDLFYDKTANIYSVNIVSKRWSDIKEKVLLYENIKCDYYIATRWNVVNWQPNLWIREQDLDRIDMVIPWSEYDTAREIKQWHYVEIGTDHYIIDQLDYYRMPDWVLESIYIRLNQKWK